MAWSGCGPQDSDEEDHDPARHAQPEARGSASPEPPGRPAAGAESPARSSLGQQADEEWVVAEDECTLEVVGSTLKLPTALYSRLYGYQRQGVTWMLKLFHKESGGILADEMGLGKTVQCAAFLASIRFTKQASRFLIVTPVSLLEQWRRELKDWTAGNGVAVHMLHGSSQERQAALRGFAARGGVVLVSFDLVRNLLGSLRTAGLAIGAARPPKRRQRQAKRGCRDDDSPSEVDEPLPPPAMAGEDQEAPWDVVIVDEGHYMRNPSCQVGKALRRVRARSRFILTGTPVQNKLVDLWALMDFVQPSLLGNHVTFERNFSEHITKGSKRNASRFAVELKDQLVRELRHLTAPHLLRRLKCDVATAAALEASSSPRACQQQELPPKTDVVLWLSQTHAELELYSKVLDTDLVRSASGQSKCGMEALRAIALLKKLCNHPLLLLPPEEVDAWRREVTSLGSLAQAPAAGAPAARVEARPPETQGSEEEEAEQPEDEAPECQQVLPWLRAMMPHSVQGGQLLSCKLRVLSVLLPQLQKRGHRCLIFSHSVRMLDLIQSCVLRVLGLKFLRIDGAVDAKDRDIKLAKFQQPDSRYFCMCLSVQTGGTGLTITAADRVILVDPAWNPSTDAQAIDRVHRFGQRKNVVVYRLITAGTMEDKMFRLQVFKRGVSKAYLEQEQQMRFFSHKELKQLFEPPCQAASTQALMAEQIGSEALEHEGLLQVVAGDVGGGDDPDASEWWQGSDVQGFSDYQRLFMFLEQSKSSEEDAVEQAKRMTGKLQREEYVQDQVVESKWRKNFVEAQAADAAEAASASEGDAD